MASPGTHGVAQPAPQPAPDSTAEPTAALEPISASNDSARAMSPTPPASAAQPPRDIAAVPHAAAPSAWSLGLAGEALEGSMPRPVWLGSLGVDYTWRRAGAAHMLLTMAGVGGYGSAPTQVGPVEHWLAAGRAELCPYFLGSGRVELWPCGAVEVGALGASDSRPTGLSARDLWAAPGASLRFRYPASGRVALSLRAAAVVPLVRETVYAGARALYSAEIIVFQAGLGVTARLW